MRVRYHGETKKKLVNQQSTNKTASKVTEVTSRATEHTKESRLKIGTMIEKWGNRGKLMWK